MSRRSLRFLARMVAQQAAETNGDVLPLADDPLVDFPASVEESSSIEAFDSGEVSKTPVASSVTAKPASKLAQIAARQPAASQVVAIEKQPRLVRPAFTIPAVKSRPRVSSSVDRSLGETLIGAIFDPNVLLIAACVVAAAVFLPKTGRLLPDLRKNSDYQVAMSRAELIPAPPRWVPQNLVEQVAKQSGLPDDLSVLDEDVARRVAAAFERHPWVRGEVRVTVGVPARLRVELDYREPVAMVHVEQAGRRGLFPIDADGVVLPASDFSPAQIASFPVIDNVSSSPRGPAGTAWDDLNVLGATQLAVLLKPSWKEFRLKSIRVTSPMSNAKKWDDLSFQLGTLGGSRIIWGRPPGSRHPGELPAEKKLERMKYYVRHHGPFDSTHGPYEFDITNWRDISRKPIAEQKPVGRQRS